ncbi:YitT family protein [Ammoniphilus sp. CFH 90114]|uniref:YitT family protein n=1 Tax=Ammoniphilus sp. CFH 90114 TaxID=2493665 RepID=UPI00100F9F66|nr:YitT family protein [Ammoniphilus sp. CFH 90114]RXT13935.1 YitT family protein [Ammoniphilus sp. CFH 90114]
MKDRIKNIIMILIGSGIMGFGINYFNIANNLAEGGVTGITILLKFMFNWDPGLVNLLINIPLLLVGWKVLGRIALIYTIIGTLSLSFFLTIFGQFRLPLEDSLLAALYAGVSVGVGLGIVFRYGGTTGGVDIIARLLNKYKGWSIGRTMFAADFLVIGISLLYLDLTGAMYTLVAVFIGARVIDFVQEGSYSAKAVTIISDENEQIAKKIMTEMERGATLLNGKGGWTGIQKDVLYCVVSRQEMIRVKHLVHEIDPYAFVIVNDVHEVLGEGFTHDEQKRPLKEA